jgi:putative oxidoreductase
VKLPALNSLEKLRDHGLFLFRAVVGGTFVFYGAAQLAAGAATWRTLGERLGVPPVATAPALVGLAVVVATLLSGILIVLGLWTRLAALALGLVLIGAAVLRWPEVKSGTLEGAAAFFYPASMATALWVVATVGGGRFGIDAVYRARQKRKKRRGGG